MPKHVDHCRSCGTKVFLDTDPETGAEANGEVCAGCKSTVCLSCKRNSCPHQPYPRTKGTVSEEEHDRLKAELQDEAALERRLAELRAARGETKVGL